MCQSGIRRLWLGAFGKSGLFMCQSVPGPLSHCCDTELGFCRLCNFDLPNKQRFSLQRHKTAKSYAFCGSMPCDAELWFSGKGERTTREKFCVGFCFCLVTVFMPGWERGETVIYAPFILVI